MPVTVDRILIWGRPFDEYVEMFALSGEDLEKRFLDCASGPACFNASLTMRGGRIISVDPIYRLSSDEITSRINEAYNMIIGQLKENMADYSWDQYNNSADEYCQVHINAMKEFLYDYNDGLREGRYIHGSLPKLPFKDGEFDIALCGNLLFVYSKQLSEDFHIQSIKELCRVSSEVRIYPLMEVGIRKSRYLESVLDKLSKDGYKAKKVKIPFEFKKGANEMLVVTAT
ncbi:Uncharacterised protein [uncultured archaeon]|nr:Uncharacterised protein [uncultured archaeon]